MESYQARTVTGLTCAPFGPAWCSARPGQRECRPSLAENSSRSDQLGLRRRLPAGNPFHDKLTSFPYGPVVAVLPDFPAMVSYAIAHHYRLFSRR